jgi:hypothetical protein
VAEHVQGPLGVLLNLVAGIGFMRAGRSTTPPGRRVTPRSEPGRRSAPPSRVSTCAAAYLVVPWLLSACGAGDDAPGATPATQLELVARSGPLPYSENNSLALFSGDSVCVLDSYEVRIVCGGRQWTEPVVLGGHGRGPGEFWPQSALVSAAPGTIGVVDYGNGRLSWFSRDGFVASVPLPPLSIPAGDAASDGTLYLHAFPGIGGPPRLSVWRAEGRGGEARDELVLTMPADRLAGTGTMMSGAVRLETGYVVRLTTDADSRLALLSAAGEFRQLLEPPPAALRYPSERDVEVYREGYARIFDGRPIPETRVRAFRTRPLPSMPRGTLFRLVQRDGTGRLWVVRTPEPDGTPVDIYDGGTYAGTRWLAGRVLAIQTRDTVLVALAEHVDPAAEYPRRWVDWYRLP